MNRVSYSPGPWRSRRFSNRWEIVRRDDRHGWILVVVFNERDVPVVKALPELVKACQVALRELVALRAVNSDRKVRGAKESPACKALRTALARAAGKRTRATASHK
jgi:hypothetical protein